MKIEMKAKGVNVFQFLKWFFDWRFLPCYIQHRLFSTGTMAVEVLSGAILVTFGLTFLVSPDNTLMIPSYHKFQQVPHVMILLATVGVGFAQLAYSMWDSKKSNVVSGFLMIVSSLVFMLISVGFMAAYPPFTTAMTTYPVLAGVTLLAGKNLINYSKCQSAE